MVNIKGFAATSLTGIMSASGRRIANTCTSRVKNANNLSIAQNVHANVNTVETGFGLSTEGARSHRKSRVRKIGWSEKRLQFP